MSKINLNILEEILFSINHDDLKKSEMYMNQLTNLSKVICIGRINTEYIMDELFTGVCFQRFNNNYENIFHFCLGILNLHKK
jgi:hypothetical protein